MKQLKTNRGLIMYLLLTIITCGIYPLWWIHSVAKDANEMFKDDGKKTRGLIMFTLFSFITCGIYAIIWWYALAERCANDARKYNQNPAITGGSYLLWCILGSLLCGLGPLIAFSKLCKGLNEGAQRYNARNNPVAPMGAAPYGAPAQPYGYAPAAPQQPYGYAPAPQQPYAPYPPQQPYGYAPAPQQPYAPAPQQPYAPAPQQPYAPYPPQAPVAPAPAPAPEAAPAPAPEAPAPEAPAADGENQ